MRWVVTERDWERARYLVDAHRNDRDAHGEAKAEAALLVALARELAQSRALGGGKP